MSPVLQIYHNLYIQGALFKFGENQDVVYVDMKGNPTNLLLPTYQYTVSSLHYKTTPSARKNLVLNERWSKNVGIFIIY